MNAGGWESSDSILLSKETSQECENEWRANYLLAKEDENLLRELTINYST